MQRQLFSCAIVTIMMVGATAVPAHAGLIEYGDFFADNVDYLDVNEFSDDGLPLFGEPTTSGDGLLFENMQFLAEATGAAGAEKSTGILNTTIAAHDGSVISALSLRESGSYTLAGLMNDAYASVSAAVIINVLEIDGIGVDPVPLDTLMDFSPSGGEFSISEDGAGTGLWEGLLNVDLDAFLASRGLAGSATRISLTITNTLNALSQDGTTASISKKDLSIVVVPTPPAALLFLLGMASGRRRHRA